jgi:hypothetical protein
MSGLNGPAEAGAAAGVAVAAAEGVGDKDPAARTPVEDNNKRIEALAMVILNFMVDRPLFLFLVELIFFIAFDVFWYSEHR